MKNYKSRFVKNSKTKKFYGMWHNFLSRCRNPNHPQFKYYGGRGIKVAKRWYKFENFLLDEWEAYFSHLQIAGAKDTTIDRINNDGNYEPGNIRYVSMKVQMNNKRPSKDIFLTYHGKTQNIKSWAKDLDIKYGTLLFRLRELNWPAEKALSTPVFEKFRNKKA